MRCISAIILSFCLLAVPSAKAGILAQFRTVFGDIEVELFEKDKPITVSNFVRYVQSGRYRDGFLHRCPTDHSLIQGGGHYVTNRGLPSEIIADIGIFGTIPNEYG